MPNFGDWWMATIILTTSAVRLRHQPGRIRLLAGVAFGYYLWYSVREVDMVKLLAWLTIIAAMWVVWQDVWFGEEDE